MENRKQNALEKTTRENRNVNTTHPRFCGIDLMRVMSMFYVVILHTLGHGGILEATLKNSSQYYAGWFVEIWAYCAVDVIAMITGFLRVNKQIKLSHYFRVWGQVVFYCLIANILVLCLFPKEFRCDVIIEAILPVSSGRYWYFSAYTGLFVFIPFLNYALCSLRKEDTKRVVLLLIAFTAYDTLVHKFTLNNGYSVIWLIIMYLIGGVIRIHNIRETKPVILCILIVILSLLTFCWKTFGVSISFAGIQISQDILVSYTSPTIVGMSVCYLLLAKQIHVNDKIGKILAFLGRGSFAVYLINDHRYIRQKFLSNRFVDWAQTSTILMITYLIVYAILFTFGAIIIDNCRHIILCQIGKCIHKKKNNN